MSVRLTEVKRNISLLLVFKHKSLMSIDMFEHCAIYGLPVPGNPPPPHTDIQLHPKNILLCVFLFIFLRLCHPSLTSFKFAVVRRVIRRRMRSLPTAFFWHECVQKSSFYIQFHLKHLNIKQKQWSPPYPLILSVVLF